jgi:CheY-like chemotaxis protein
MTHYKDINIVSDESLLKQVLTNIISNAIKFTHDGGLYVETDVTEHNQLKITVEDTGIGMTDDELNRIFKPFSQANQEISKRFGGTGLGLSITRKILSLMKGNIEISSTYGSGTKIIITCPIEISKEKIMSEQDDVLTMRKGLNILIAEDNTLSLKATKQLLENIGLKVEIAKNGIEVLNQYKDYPFNLILMDVSMPKMDGFEATKHLREQDQNIPIIAMTANTYDEHIKACFAAGMTDILYKPFKAKDLYKMIDKHTK